MLFRTGVPLSLHIKLCKSVFSRRIMLSLREQPHEQVLEALRHTVADAAAFFSTTSPILSDGRYTTHGVLAQMVFWHERYVEVLRALVAGEQPDLIDGTQEMLNAAARHRYAREPMAVLAARLSEAHQELDQLLRAQSDWSINYPIKRDSGFCNVDERVRLIEENIRNRTAIFKRALRPSLRA